MSSISCVSASLQWAGHSTSAWDSAHLDYMIGQFSNRHIVRYSLHREGGSWRVAPSNLSRFEDVGCPGDLVGTVILAEEEIVQLLSYNGSIVGVVTPTHGDPSTAGPSCPYGSLWRSTYPFMDDDFLSERFDLCATSGRACIVDSEGALHVMEYLNMAD